MQKQYHIADIQLDEITPAFTDVKTGLTTSLNRTFSPGSEDLKNTS